MKSLDAAGREILSVIVDAVAVIVMWSAPLEEDSSPFRIGAAANRPVNLMIFFAANTRGVCFAVSRPESRLLCGVAAGSGQWGSRQQGAMEGRLIAPHLEKKKKKTHVRFLEQSMSKEGPPFM